MTEPFKEALEGTGTLDRLIESVAAQDRVYVVWDAGEDRYLVDGIAAICSTRADAEKFVDDVAKSVEKSPHVEWDYSLIQEVSSINPDWSRNHANEVEDEE